MKIELSGQHIVVVGAFKHFASADALCSRLGANGAASARRSIVQASTLVVEGKAQKTYSPNKNVLQGKARGLPILDEEQVIKLLKEGFIELEEEAHMVEGDEAVGGLIGDARALLDGPPTSETWTGIIELVDACADEQLELLVDYLEPQLERWEIDRYARWIPAAKAPVRALANSDFFRWLERGSLRVAPPHWIARAVEADSPKLRLIDTISLRELKIGGSQALKLLGQASLTNLRYLDLHDSKLTKTFWKKAPLLPSFQGLKSLRVSAFTVEFADVIKEAPELPNLERVALEYGYFGKARAFTTLLSAPMTRHVKTVSVTGPNEVDYIFGALQQDGLPFLEELEIWTYELPRPMRAALEHKSIAQHVSRVSIVAADEYTDAYLNELCALEYHDIDELDLSGINAESRLLGREAKIEGHRAQALRLLPGSNMVKTVKRLRLGDLWSAELAAALDGQVELID